MFSHPMGIFKSPPLQSDLSLCALQQSQAQELKFHCSLGKKKCAELDETEHQTWASRLCQPLSFPQAFAAQPGFCFCCPALALDLSCRSGLPASLPLETGAFPLGMGFPREARIELFNLILRRDPKFLHTQSLKIFLRLQCSAPSTNCQLQHGSEADNWASLCQKCLESRS